NGQVSKSGIRSLENFVLCPLPYLVPATSSVPCKMPCPTNRVLVKGVHHALEDFWWIHDNIASRPTQIAELVPLDPVAEGHHDVSGSGAGGIWFPSAMLVPQGYHALKPLLWHDQWPDYIKQQLVMEDNPNGTIINSDLELAGGLLHLEALTQAFDITEHTFRRDFRTAQKTVQVGVTAHNAAQAITVWNQWTEFTTELGLNPVLQALQDKVPVLQVFALRVCVRELAANGNPIRAWLAEAFMRHVVQMFLHMGAQDPWLNDVGKIDFRLQRMVAEWKKKDSPPCRVKPVPIRVIRHIAYLAQHSTSSNSFLVADADMIIIAFFFLLWPGDEWIFSTTLLHSSSMHGLPLSPSPTKNGVRVKAIIRRVLYLQLNSTPPDVPLARLFNSNSHITASVITSTLRDAVTLLGPELPSDISACCLRALGAMALLLGQTDTDIIRLQSDEMLRYLHLQAAPLMQDYACKMLMACDY
ncbi:LOW QUALITY PROTEIN: hypothetical protein ACHAW6_001427, partial [Cyclotella cf. meneghiniana]